MIIDNYITVSVVNESHPIPTEGHVSGDKCYDLSTHNWYEFDGTVWNIWMSHIICGVSCQKAQILEANFIKSFSAGVATKKDWSQVMLSSTSASVANDLSEVIKKIPRLINED